MTAHQPQPGETRQPPPVTALTYAQKAGWACCFCGKDIWTGAVSAGIARGRSGAHVLDVEVFACPDCQKTATPGDQR
ncbi:hypothetical protein ACH40E_02785 [Streptomyces acidicola]|uniref:hypothetical protein n=1 Tax=Streptomyces acidicola TaxID=2596892 RepID=UPI0037A220E2